MPSPWPATLVLLAACFSVLQAQPLVIDLTDDTFEHQTQAATGQTTGTWFVLFTSSAEPSLRHLSEDLWPEVAASSREEGSKVLFARVDTGIEQPLAERFGASVPMFLLFREQQMFKYEGAEPSQEGLRAFLDGGYRKGSPLRVPLPASSLENFNRLVNGLINQDGLIRLAGFVAFCILVLEVMRRTGMIAQPSTGAGSGATGLTEHVTASKGKSVPQAVAISSAPETDADDGEPDTPPVRKRRVIKE